MDLKQLKGLRDLARLQFQARQREMAELRQQEAALRQNLADLLGDRAARDAAKAGAADPAMRAGADVRWHVWIDQRRAVINQELAKVRARMAALEPKLRRAFGKDLVAQQLQKTALEDARQEAARRDDQLS